MAVVAPPMRWPTSDYRTIIGHPVSGVEIDMAKGQLRSNKEAKKPKQEKKPAPPVGGFQVPSRNDKATTPKS